MVELFAALEKPSQDQDFCVESCSWGVTLLYQLSKKKVGCWAVVWQMLGEWNNSSCHNAQIVWKKSGLWDTIKAVIHEEAMDIISGYLLENAGSQENNRLFRCGATDYSWWTSACCELSCSNSSWKRCSQGYSKPKFFLPLATYALICEVLNIYVDSRRVNCGLWHFIPRNENWVAHTLAQHVSCNPGDMYWEFTPPCIFHLLL